MHRTSIVKRNTDVALPQRHGAREHRTGLPYVPSTPSTRSSSSSRSSSEFPQQSWEHRPQLSGVMGRQKIVNTHRSPVRPMRNASSPMRQASPPQYPKGTSNHRPIVHNHATKEAPPYYDDDPDDAWDRGASPYFQRSDAPSPRNTSPTRVTMVMTTRTPTTNSSGTRRTLRNSPSSNPEVERNRSSNHSQNNHRVMSRNSGPSPTSKLTKEGSFTTASLSNSSSSSKRHLLRPNTVLSSSDASFRHSDAASLRTTSTGASSNSGTRLHPSSRNSRLAHSVQEEDDDEYSNDAASFNDDSVAADDLEQVGAAFDDNAFLLNASFVSIDFGSTVGVAPPVPPLLSQQRPSQQQRYHAPPPQQQYPEEDHWNSDDNYYGYGDEEEEYLDDEDDALLFRDPHDNGFDDEEEEEEDFAPPPVRLSEVQKLERAVRRGSSLASSGYQEAAVLATQLTERVSHPAEPPPRRQLTRTALSKRHLQPGRKVGKAPSHGEIVPPQPQRRSSVSKTSSQGAMPIPVKRMERAKTVQREVLMKPPSRDMPVSAAVSRRRSSLQHNPQVAASYRSQQQVGREPQLQRSRSYDDDDFYGMPRGYDVQVEPPPRQRPGLGRTLSQPDLFDWKETDVDDMSFSDLAIRKR